ncbi:MAG: hypothetical protein PHH91_08940 [Desulfuromonadaceae bacterium]|nr:hypothetical protein [Desulfuromonadaceae bacterium]
MKDLNLSSFKQSWRLIFVCLLSAYILTGCGSSGTDTTAGVGSGGTGVLAKAVTGTVADGYLVNATVFLDKNGNYQLDVGEPSTTTDSNGTYALNIDPADVGKYPIVVLAIKGITLDKDTNQTIANSYVLSLSRDSVTGTVSNFISPMSSQIRELMETGAYASLQQASDALSSQLELPIGTDMRGDYLQSNNTSIHTAAQNMSTLMGNQMEQVMGVNGSTITVDVNRYRGMMGLMFNNMSSSWCQSSQSSMGTFSSTMTTMLANTPTTPVGQPYWDMSTAYSNMMGGMSTSNSSMMGTY